MVDKVTDTDFECSDVYVVSRIVGENTQKLSSSLFFHEMHSFLIELSITSDSGS